MKPRFSNQRNQALTLVEVLLVIVVLAALALIILPALSAAKRTGGSRCVTNIKEIGLAFQIWEGDNNGKFPMEVSVMNGGAKESAVIGNVVAIFQVMSNELSTPKILLCQKDKDKNYATNFNSDFSAKNISYFIGLNADKDHLQSFLSGDDNFAISGVPVKSGTLELSSNAAIAWTTTRHNRVGNIGLADGSVQMLNNPQLPSFIQATGLATNRLTIP
ncbi:MAG TPA: type II secretion system protein [Verrucomicrobiae bacterium]|jgi:prepilin-type processing-associated H-X9-DG protein|nr:type II secretion system protein [Verrucomicrobiae bacterium]